jgi:hypothetical protein
MNHVWGLFSHPDREMHVIRGENETVAHHYTHHVLLMAAVPVICAFIGTTQIGWNFGDGTVVKLNWFTGLYLAILFYGVMLAGWPSWGGSFTGWLVTIHNARRWHTVWSLPDMSRLRCS